MKSVPEMLRDAAKLYEERNASYGNNYKRVGHMMVALFPDGLTVETVDDWNRLLIFNHLVDNLSREAANFGNEGHDDSLADLSVYATMLREVNAEARVRREEEERHEAEERRQFHEEVGELTRIVHEAFGKDHIPPGFTVSHHPDGSYEITNNTPMEYNAKSDDPGELTKEVLEEVLRRGEIRPFIGVDYSKGKDYSAEVHGSWNHDGSVMIHSARIIPPNTVPPSVSPLGEGDEV